MNTARWWVLALLGLLLVQIVFSQTANKPTFTIPLFSDDTSIDGLTCTLLTSFLANVANNLNTYPFNIQVQIHFDYTGGPEVFYDAITVANQTGSNQPAVLMGPETSSAVQLISTIGDVYQIPIMVFWATSPYLSSKDEYPNVWRTISSDAIRMQAWVSICQQFQWAHVIIINENSLYGAGASQAFTTSASAVGIVVTTVSLTSMNDIPSALVKIELTGVKIIVAPCTTYLLPIVTKAIERNMMGPTSGYVWIIGDTVGNLLVSGYSSNYAGSITALEPNQLLLQTYNTTANQPFVQNAFNQVQAAYNAVNLSSPFRNTPLVPPQANLTKALDLMWQAGSLPTSLARAFFVLCDAMAAAYQDYGTVVNATTMITYLRNFKESLLGATVQFNQYQDFSESNMGIVNMRPTEAFHVVGSWSLSQGFRLNSGEVFIWPDGSTRVPDDGIAIEQVLTFSSVPGVVITCFSVALCLLILLTFGITMKHFNTPVFRLASPYSLLTILLGLFLFSAQSFFYLDRPDFLFCQLRQWFYYMGMTLIYSALTIKTWRVWVLFKESNSLKKGLIITNLRLMAYTGLLLLPAIFLALLRTFLSQDRDQRVLASDHSRVDVVCQGSQPFWPYLQLFWSAAELVPTLILSWFTRSVPSGFNETQYVFISVYAICTVGVIGVISAAATAASYPQLSIGITVSQSLLCTTVMWAMLFVPKVYIAIFHPERNTAQLMRPEPEQQPSIVDMTEGFATDTMQVPLMNTVSSQEN